MRDDHEKLCVQHDNYSDDDDGDHHSMVELNKFNREKNTG